MSRIEILRRNLRRIDYVSPSSEERSTILNDPKVRQEPLPVRKAKALALFLREASLHIYPEELIVGLPFREEPIPAKDEKSAIRKLIPVIHA